MYIEVLLLAVRKNMNQWLLYRCTEQACIYNSSPSGSEKNYYHELVATVYVYQPSMHITVHLVAVNKTVNLIQCLLYLYIPTRYIYSSSPNDREQNYSPSKSG